MRNLVIIGGSDAGMSAALRAREVSTTISVKVVVADSFPNYSICGIPFFLSGEVADWHVLAHRSAEEITRQGIQLLLNTTATQITPATLSYTPPLSSPWGPIQLSAQAWIARVSQFRSSINNPCFD